MYWFDGLILGIMALTITCCFIKGLIRSVFGGILGFIISLIVAAKVYPVLKPVFYLLLPNLTITAYLSFISPFLISVIVLRFIGNQLAKILRFARIRWLDRFLGIPLGFMTGIVICGLICSIIALTPYEKSVIGNSIFAPHLLSMNEPFKKRFLSDIGGNFMQRFEKIKKSDISPQLSNIKKNNIKKGNIKKYFLSEALK